MLEQEKIKAGFSIIILAAATWLMHGFIAAMLWAVIIAVATWPLRVKIALKSGLSDIGIAVIMTTAVAVLLLFPVVYALILAAADMGALTSWIAEIQKIGLAVPDWIHLIPIVGERVASWWFANLADPDSLSVFLGGVDHAGIKEFAQNLGAQAAHRLATLVFTIVTLFFLYKEGDNLSKKTLVLDRKSVV